MRVRRRGPCQWRGGTGGGWREWRVGGGAGGEGRLEAVERGSTERGEWLEAGSVHGDYVGRILLVNIVVVQVVGISRTS